MKVLLLLISISFVFTAYAEDNTNRVFPSSDQDTYFRVALEKANGVDVRAQVIPAEIIATLEKQGKTVRPSRTDANVSYWAFFKNGDFATCDIINDPSKAHLSYEKLEALFARAPHDGTKWTNRSDHSIVVGERLYSVTSDGAETTIALLQGDKEVYHYLGVFITSPQPSPGPATETSEPGASIIEPLQAVLAAADRPEGITGTFRLQVKNAGRQEGWLYLDSEEDYHDPRCLVVALPPSAAQDLGRLLGDDPVVSLRSRTIKVSGTALRTKIVFFSK